MKSNNNFQLIFVIVFIAAAIFGIFVFSGAIPLGNSGSSTGGQGTVVLWGTNSASAMAPLLESFNGANPSYTVTYVQKSADTFNQDLLEALASGTGPDMFFLPDNLALSYNNKIFTIPYTSYPIASFKNNFAQAGEVFTTSKGILAFPLAIDPLVMYYNRSTLDSNGVVYPPKDWDELTALVPTLTKKNDSNQLVKSTIALGQFSNVAHAKDILSALFIQTGNAIIAEKDGSFAPTLNDTSRSNPAAVVSFYTDFADSLKSSYSWNKSFPNSTDAFSAENTAFYLGFASELRTLINKNPNENFLVTPIPQVKGATNKITSARVTGIAIAASSKNFNTAFLAASTMATGTFAADYAAAFGVAPARRDLLAAIPQDTFSPTFYTSALYARSWLDPSPNDTDDIFRGMVEKVLSGGLSPIDAVTDANAKLGLLLAR